MVNGSLINWQQFNDGNIMVLNRISCRLGEGSNVAFWKNKWLGAQQLMKVYHDLFIKSNKTNRKVEKMGSWQKYIWE